MAEVEAEKIPRTLVLGCDVNFVSNLPPLLTEVINDGFDFLSVPLVHPRHRRDSAATGVSKARAGAFTRSDLLLKSSSWTRSVVGKLSPWLWPAIEAQGPDGEFSPSRRNAEDALKQELAWASHLSLPAVLFPQLPHQNSNTCRLINQCVQQLPYYQVWVTVPLADWSNDRQDEGGTAAAAAEGSGVVPSSPGHSSSSSTSSSSSPSSSSSSSPSPWHRWNKLRCLCERSQALFVALEVGPDLPEDEEEVARWEAEPVKVLLLHTSAFITNKKGFPVLSKRHQSVVKRFSKFNVQIVVTGKPRHDSGRKVYQQYLRHMHQQLAGMTSEEQLEAPYLDYLQAPLQPLMDNLESQTYETFEKDPVKYVQYRKAVKAALLDLIKLKHPTCRLQGPGAEQPEGAAAAAAAEGTAAATAAAVAVAAASAQRMVDDNDDEEEGSDYDEGDDEDSKDELSAAIKAASVATGGGVGSGGEEGQTTKKTKKKEKGGGVKVVAIEVVLMVVGAGRGPLVKASLAACAEVEAMILLANKKSLIAASSASSQSSSSNLNLKLVQFKLKPRVFAVEKNANAVVTLRSLVHTEQWANVTVVSEDMRTWQPQNPDKDLADIMVSELLGSFGDNELSPECLDGAQRFLRPHTGVSIPCDYTSYLAPLAASKLWNEAKHSKTIDSPLKALETAYVVKMHNAKVPLDHNASELKAKLAFTFNHPNPDWPEHIDNSRFRSLQFCLDQDATIHGLAGYFESRLYGDVYISILPGSPNFSHGMFSWFPLYFPIRDPVFVAAGEHMKVDIWRGVSSTKVWYEWALATQHHTTPVHNPNGRSYWIGL